MAPLLIDSRDLFKFVLVSVVTVIIVFTSGVFVGHQRAATYYQAGRDVYPLPLPGRATVAENLLETQLPLEIEAGEFIDVDHPESSVRPVTNNVPVQTLVSVPEKITEIQQDDKAVQTKENSQKNAANTEKHVISTQPDAAIASVVSSSRTGGLDNIKYSIQAGVYGRLVNAENMMKMLQMQRYEAYITDYTNRKNETRYNVRFGYYPDKKSALESLGRFKSDKNGDGYLVKFSADNIVNLADATDAEKNVTPPIKLQGHEKTSTPAVIPPVTTTDKVSQADVLTDTLIKTN